MTKKINTKILAEIAIFSAMAFAIDILQGGIFKGVFPNGGSIGFSMVPIFIIAYRRGFLPGFLSGLIVSIVQMLGGVYVINGASFESQFMQVMGPFFQIMLDYVLATTVIGLSGCLAGMYKKSEGNTKLIVVACGVIGFGLLKYLIHVLAGGIFWLGDGGDSFWGVANSSWLYSFVYNGAYSIPSIALQTVIMVIIAKCYPVFLNPSEEE